MGQIIQTREGAQVILSKYDLLPTIRVNAGDEVADFVNKEFEQADAEQERIELEFNSDYESLEATVDEYADALNEIWALAEELQKNIGEIVIKALNKKAILDKLENIIEITRRF